MEYSIKLNYTLCIVVCIAVIPHLEGATPLILHHCLNKTTSDQLSSCFYFFPFTAPSFLGHAQNVARSCSCGDQAVTHTHTQEDYYNPPPMHSG